MAMIIGQVLAGEVVPMVEAAIFVLMAIAGITMAFLMMRDLHEEAIAAPANFARSAR